MPSRRSPTAAPSREHAVRAAWARSFLAALPPSAAEALLATAHEELIEPGQNLYRELAEPRYAFAALVVRGLVRVYVTSPKGRRVTLRYARAGDVVGLPAMLARGAPAGGEALTHGTILHLDPGAMRRLGNEVPEVGWATAAELARQLFDLERMLTCHVFGTVRERIARHLQDLATMQDGRLVVRVTQQDLADSIGSVREVAARAIATMRDEGFLERAGDTIVILDAARLARVADGLDG